MAKKYKNRCLNKEKDTKMPKNNNKNIEILQKKPRFNGYNAENSITYFDYILNKWVRI